MGVRLGFIGAGNMAEAIARGVIAAGLYRSNELLAADPSAQRRELFEMQLKVPAVADPTKVAASSAAVILAVKPQVMAAALAQIKTALPGATPVISIAAGITCKFIEHALDGSRRVIRVMPNTPMLAGAGMSALAKGAFATEQDIAEAEKIFAAAGKTVRLDESLINAVTAVSGSGPAYVFYLAEAMAAAGEKLGLPPQAAELLARQTIVGAGRLLESSADSSAELRQKVTSPGGTTQAALETLRTGQFMELLANAIAAAERRGRELAQ